ncbi:MAG: murein L,D-transpeptidase family protein [Granulosicoccus sp.]
MSSLNLRAIQQLCIMRCGGRHNIHQNCALVLLVCCLFSSVSAFSRPHVEFDSSVELDRQVSTTLHYLATGNLAQARLFARQLAWRFPRFALGNLLSAELESMAAFQDVTISQNNQLSGKLLNLLLEAQARLKTSNTSSGDTIPAQVIQLGNNVSEVLLVDLSSSTLFQFAAGQSKPTLIRQHYISSGKAGYGKLLEGDNKTPLGVYKLTGRRSDASLPDLYGSGALILDYPNALDQRLGRTGSGIWLHGVPHGQRSRAPRSSEGCVTMSNDHFTRLHDGISISDSRVILSDRVTWVSKTQQKLDQNFFRALFEQYQRAWATSDPVALARIYQGGEFQQGQIRLNSADFIKVLEAFPHSHDAPLTPDYLQALTSIPSDKISVFRSPSLGATGKTGNTLSRENYVVMSAYLGGDNEHQITIFWVQGEDRQWRVLTERLDGEII